MLCPQQDGHHLGDPRTAVDVRTSRPAVVHTGRGIQRIAGGCRWQQIHLGTCPRTPPCRLSLGVCYRVSRHSAMGRCKVRAYATALGQRGPEARRGRGPRRTRRSTCRRGARGATDAPGGHARGRAAVPPVCLTSTRPCREGLHHEPPCSEGFRSWTRRRLPPCEGTCWCLTRGKSNRIVQYNALEVWRCGRGTRGGASRDGIEQLCHGEP
jgi:hypothetical protein